jgi:hypothetical protein
MTLTHVKNLILSHFFQNSTFSIRDDSATIEFDKEDQDSEKLIPFKDDLIRMAIKDFEAVGLLKQVNAESEMYILIQPISAFTQQVVISPLCAEMLGDTVNGFLQSTDSDRVCNKLAITENDIMTLVHAYHSLLEDVELGEDFPDN